MGRLIRFALKARPALAAAALVLAACTPHAREDEAAAQARAAYARCDAGLASGRIKTHLDAVNCAVPAVTAAYEGAAYPFDDLLYISIQARRIGAARVDAGAISEAQYRQDVAALDARIVAEEAKRRAAIDRGGRPERTPVEALVQGLPSFAPEPAAAAAPKGNGDCVSLGQIRPCK